MAIQQENILGDVRRTSTWAQKTLSLVFGSPSEQFCPKITFSMVVSKRYCAETCLIRCFPLKMIYSMHLMWLGEIPEYISDVCSTKNLLLNLFARVMLMITWWTMWRKCRTLRGSSAEDKWDPKNFFRDLVRTRMDINRDESLRFRHSWPLEIFGFESDEFWNFSNYVITWSTIDWHWLTSISPRDAKLSLWTNKGSTSAHAK